MILFFALPQPSSEFSPQVGNERSQLDPNIDTPRIENFLQAHCHQILPSSNPAPPSTLFDTGSYKELRLHARLHGLPTTFARRIFNLMSSGLAQDLKLCLAITIRYASNHNQAWTTPETLQGILQAEEQLASRQDESEELQLSYEIISEILLAICKILEKNPEKAVNCLQTISPSLRLLLSAEAKDAIQQHIEASMRTSNPPFGDEKEDVTLESEIEPTFKRGGIRKAFGNMTTSPPKPDAVRVQQQTAARCDEHSSEKLQLAKTNLAKALAGARGKQVSSSSTTEPLAPPKPAKTGSDRFWFGSTFTQVQNLRNLSRNNVISASDQTYLIDRWDAAKWTFRSDIEVHRLTAETFYHISQRQIINDGHFRKWLTRLCEKEDVEFCKWLLLMLQNVCLREPSRFTICEATLKLKLDSVKEKKEHTELRSIIMELFSDHIPVDGGAESRKAMIIELLENSILRINSATKKEREVALRFVTKQSLNPTMIQAFFSNVAVTHHLVSALLNAETSDVFQNVGIIMENLQESTHFFGLRSDQIVKLSNLLIRPGLQIEFASPLLRIILRNLPPESKVIFFDS